MRMFLVKWHCCPTTHPSSPLCHSVGSIISTQEADSLSFQTTKAWAESHTYSFCKTQAAVVQLLIGVASSTVDDGKSVSKCRTSGKDWPLVYPWWWRRQSMSSSMNYGSESMLLRFWFAKQWLKTAIPPKWWPFQWVEGTRNESREHLCQLFRPFRVGTVGSSDKCKLTQKRH